MEHLTLNQIVAYVHEMLNETEILEIDSHLADCSFCARKVKRHYMLKDHFDDIWNCCVDEEHEEEMVKDRVDELNSVMDSLLKKPLLKSYCQDMRHFIKKFFPSHSLQLSPVFGEGKSSIIKMLSPFGKVKFPIVFRWEEIKSVKRTIIKINEKEFSTKSTLLELDRDTFPFQHDKEYEWEISMIDINGTLIDGPIGYCLTCSEEEDNLLKEFEQEILGMNLSSEIHQILNGVMFESKEFYMDAITSYKKAFKITRDRDLIIRIVYCYEKLELKELREEWRHRLEEEMNR